MNMNLLLTEVYYLCYIITRLVYPSECAKLVDIWFHAASLERYAKDTGNIKLSVCRINIGLIGKACVVFTKGRPIIQNACFWNCSAFWMFTNPCSIVSLKIGRIFLVIVATALDNYNSRNIWTWLLFHLI